MTLFVRNLLLLFVVIFSFASFQNGRAETFVPQMFSDKDCLDLVLGQKIEHRFGPFKLLKTGVEFHKNLCEFSISYKKWYFFRERVVFDVCREPVHMRRGMIESSMRVLKREDNEFLDIYKDLMKIFLDDALIYAKGEKEDLTSEHGKLFCSYLLSKNYLGKGIVLSRYAPGIEARANLLGSHQQELKDNAKDIEAPPKVPVVIANPAVTEEKKRPFYKEWFFKDDKGQVHVGTPINEAPTDAQAHSPAANP